MSFLGPLLATLPDCQEQRGELCETTKDADSAALHTEGEETSVGLQGGNIGHQCHDFLPAHHSCTE